MRHGNGQSRADRNDRPRPITDDLELTAERELLPRGAIAEHGGLAERVGTIWRVLRGMGISDEDVMQSTRVSFDHAFQQLSLAAGQAKAAPSTLAGLPIERVIDPLLVAAYRAASSEWRPLVHKSEDDEISASSVRFQGELLVLGLLGTLDEVKRSCLLLADMELFSSPEIAALTGLRLDVVYDELRKARKAFERARKRYDQAGATIDAESDTRELLALARARFSPAPGSLESLCSELSERFEAAALRVGGPHPDPDPDSAA